MSTLGVNARLVLVVWPLAIPVSARTLDLALGSGVLGALAAGVFALARGRRTAAAWLCLCAVPASLAGAIAVRDEAWNQQAHAGPALVIQVLSLLAYAAAAAHATTRVEAPIASRSAPLANDAPAAPAPPGRVRAALVAGVAAGSFAIAILAPSAGGWSALDRAWSETAREGGVLTAVAGASVAIALVTLFGGALRTDEARDLAAPDRALRVAALLIAAVLGATTWWLIHR